ncbi:MAG: hypothetical protein EXQ95_13470 [Alphaproteobacteria bacterium]|nr:hypothetical protein [Alphaproteobacteria bacterium]
MTPAAAMERLRLVAAIVCDHDDPVGPWFAQRVAEYEQGAQAGLKLDRVLGLTPGPGAEPWWATARRQRRDDMIRGLATKHFGHGSAIAGRGLVHALTVVITRYETRGTWRQDRVNGRPPVAKNRGLDAALFDLLSLELPITRGVVKTALTVRSERDQGTVQCLKPRLLSNT